MCRNHAAKRFQLAPVWSITPSPFVFPRNLATHCERLTRARACIEADPGVDQKMTTEQRKDVTFGIRTYPRPTCPDAKQMSLTARKGGTGGTPGTPARAAAVSVRISFSCCGFRPSRGPCAKFQVLEQRHRHKQPDAGDEGWLNGERPTQAISQAEQSPVDSPARL